MHAIFKYPIPLEDSFALGLPMGAKVLCFQVQHERPMIWALVDPEAAEVPRHFRLAGTGHPVKDADALRFVGTIQLRGGSLVFHLFECLELAS